MAAEPARRAGRAALDSIVAAAQRVEMVREGLEGGRRAITFTGALRLHSFGLGSASPAAKLHVTSEPPNLFKLS